MITASKALDRLRDGNARFVSGERANTAGASQKQRNNLTSGQEPFAVVLGCSDSRVPVEVIFDQGFGDLFVVRVAGNIVAPSIVGSIEYATQRLGTRLVLVLGHSNCGALLATLENRHRSSEGLSPGLGAIVDAIRPALEGLLVDGPPSDKEDLMRRAVKANVQNSARRLRNESEVLKRLIRDDGLLVLGAEYSLETGEADFFDGLPQST